MMGEGGGSVERLSYAFAAREPREGQRCRAHAVDPTNPDRKGLCGAYLGRVVGPPADSFPPEGIVPCRECVKRWNAMRHDPAHTGRAE